MMTKIDLKHKETAKVGDDKDAAKLIYSIIYCSEDVYCSTFTTIII